VDDDIEQLLDLGLEFEGLRCGCGHEFKKWGGKPIPLPAKINATGAMAAAPF
jgi:hypothetical protein